MQRKESKRMVVGETIIDLDRQEVLSLLREVQELSLSDDVVGDLDQETVTWLG